MAAKGKRRKQLDAKKAAKKAAMKAGEKPTSKSKYALKCRGIYPPNSPYLTRWAQYT